MAVAAREEIDALVAFAGRGPGSDAERRAAKHLAGRFAGLGREADIENVDAWPRWPAAWALSFAVAVLGSVVAVDHPLLGTLIVLLAAAAPPATRRLLGRRASQNVLSWEDGDKEGTVVLVAHYDAGPGELGWRLHPGLLALAALLACCILRIAGPEGTLLTAVQFVPTIVLIASAPALVDLALSPASRGANDNAAGVAAAIALADRLGGRLDNFNLWVLLTGAQESLADGMRGFMRRHRKGLDAERTVFVNLEALGQGSVRFGRREGLLLPTRSHQQLLGLCEQIAEDDERGAAFGAEPLLIRDATDASAARRAGFPSITITCRGERAMDEVDAGALARATAFCSELLERLDTEIGPRLSGLSEPERSVSEPAP